MCASMSQSSRSLLVIPALLVVAVFGVVAYKVYPILNPTIVATAEPASHCDLHRGPCTSRFEGGEEVTFSIQPNPIKVMEPLILEVVTSHDSPWSVEVDFQGVDMNMGFNRPELKKEAGGRFTGETMLPTCIRGQMVWEANVLIRTADGYHSAPYRFTTVRN